MAEEKLGVIITLLGSINAKLVDLVAVIGSRQIVETLKEEEKTEAIIMDLTEVQVIAVTDKAILITKKGYQKWIPKSTIKDATGINEGDFLTDIELNENGAKWLPDKSWEPFKVVKKGG